VPLGGGSGKVAVPLPQLCSSPIFFEFRSEIYDLWGNLGAFSSSVQPVLRQVMSQLMWIIYLFFISTSDKDFGWQTNERGPWPSPAPP